MSGHDHEELIDYEDEHDIPNLGATSGGAGDADGKDKKNFSGIHSTGFR
jgi:ATP-dependent RNA helicase UAP56/SUB2